MAEHGLLTDDELERIVRRAEAAQRRIDAGEERISSGFLHCDQAAVELAQEVEQAREQRKAAA